MILVSIIVALVFYTFAMLNFNILMGCYTPNYKDKGFVLIKTNQWEVR